MRKVEKYGKARGPQITIQYDACALETADGRIHMSGRLYVLHCNDRYSADMSRNVEQTTYCNDRVLSFVHDDKRLFSREN